MMGSRSFADVSRKDGEAAGDGDLNLARRADLQVGSARIRPSLRTIEGPGGSVTVEPRVMQVLLALLDADGAVRTREDLLQRCWNGVIVGEDSLTRAIAEARRAARVGDGSFAIETIPRIGYRLVTRAAEGPIAAGAERPPGGAEPPAPLVTRRRLLIGGGATAAAVAAGAGLWFSVGRSVDPRFAELVESGRSALRDALPARDAEAVRLFREATALAPDQAEGWGWLALALRRTAIRAQPDQAEPIFKQSEEATWRALDLDRREPNARVVFAQARGQLDDRIAAEDRLREILADEPDNVAALTLLTAFLQSVGRLQESWDFNERTLAVEPLAVVQQQRRALKHWIFGRDAEAVHTVDGALRRWPRHPLLWQARLQIYAYSGRPRAALALLEDSSTRPDDQTPQSLDTWRASLRAIEMRDSASIEAARAANLAAATRTPSAASFAIMTLCYLGDTSAAFAVAEGFLLRRGPVVGRPQEPMRAAMTQNPIGLQTQWLFTPATQALRADGRFPAFCRDIGLADYWRRRGIGPDQGWV
jgi:DNA-binding winged helix-turn-helix (wHTH) protein